MRKACTWTHMHKIKVQVSRENSPFPRRVAHIFGRRLFYNAFSWGQMCVWFPPLPSSSFSPLVEGKNRGQQTLAGGDEHNSASSRDLLSFLILCVCEKFRFGHASSFRETEGKHMLAASNYPHNKNAACLSLKEGGRRGHPHTHTCACNIAATTTAIAAATTSLLVSG